MRLTGAFAAGAVVLAHVAAPALALAGPGGADLRFEYADGGAESGTGGGNPRLQAGGGTVVVDRVWPTSLHLGAETPGPESAEDHVREMLDSIGGSAQGFDSPAPSVIEMSLTETHAPSQVRWRGGGSAPPSWDAARVAPSPRSGGHVQWSMGGGMALRGTSLRYSSDDGVAFLDLSAELGFDLTNNAGIWLGYQRVEAGFVEGRLDETANREALFVRLELRF